MWNSYFFPGLQKSHPLTLQTASLCNMLSSSTTSNSCFPLPSRSSIAAPHQFYIWIQRCMLLYLQFYWIPAYCVAMCCHRSMYQSKILVVPSAQMITTVYPTFVVVLPLTSPNTTTIKFRSPSSYFTNNIFCHKLLWFFAIFRTIYPKELNWLHQVF